MHPGKTQIATQLARRAAAAALVAFTVAIAAGSGCAKNKGNLKDENGPSVVGTVGGDDSGGLESDAGNALGLRTIRFPYDSHLLTPEAKEILKENARILLSERPHARIQIEGHCDNRGGVQYNIALGEKRAGATRRFLVDRGVSAHRLTVISFGKEKPLEQADSEEAHGRNRRANFVVTSR